MSNSIELTPAQRRAEVLYLDSITYENDFKPLSYSKLEEILKKEGFQASRSAIGRWAKKFDWEEKAKQIVTAATTKDGKAKDIIAKSSLASNTEKILNDFEANEALKDDAYAVLAKQMQHYVTQINTHGNLSLDNTKVVLKILEVTTLREDKLLDRQAMLAATKLAKSTDVLAAVEKEVIDIEVDD